MLLCAHWPTASIPSSGNLPINGSQRTIGGIKPMSQAVKTQAVEIPTYPYFTEEHAMLRESVKQFSEREIAPNAEEWDEAGIFPRELFKKAGELGLFGIRTDPRWGGNGLDW